MNVGFRVSMNDAVLTVLSKLWNVKHLDFILKVDMEQIVNRISTII